jgi:hypothetical protein
MPSQLNVDSIRPNTSGGAVTFPELPCASVGLSTANTKDTSNPYTSTGTIIFDQVFVNQGSVYDTSNGRFTAPVAGVYELSVSMLQDDDGTTGAFDIRFSKNGTDIDAASSPYSGQDTMYHTVSFIRLIDLSANDYLTMRLVTGGIYISATNYYNVANFKLVG